MQKFFHKTNNDHPHSSDPTTPTQTPTTTTTTTASKLQHTKKGFPSVDFRAFQDETQNSQVSTDSNNPIVMANVAAELMAQSMAQLFQSQGAVDTESGSDGRRPAGMDLASMIEAFGAMGNQSNQIEFYRNSFLQLNPIKCSIFHRF